ncbi:hypothetical protein H2201_007678 [Coniosporium apollinis]|uniref:Uncharacterized protein n=2 Tax=Coniosporium TaxID=2810619 RepID=A0ABQ9NMK7_9PEZI|nr:hypothetical protein H2199_008564 [Cladosporium sp. JES 115]KAJ9658713.1 hypothetical protein H2201_007678 [Coniosporium apollinis]
MAPVSEYLYHVVRTMIDYHHDPSGASQEITVNGTYTDLSAAKTAAKTALFDDGYEEEWFTTFDIKGDPEEWTHGDGNIVYARAPEGEVFIVGIKTAPNMLEVEDSANHKIESELYHVLQTTIHYSKDRSGGDRETEIPGTFTTYDAAKDFAATCLLDEEVTKDDFEEFDEFEGQDDWPYGSDVVVHAVGVNGDNSIVSVIRKG